MVYYSGYTEKYDHTYSFLSSVTTTKAVRDGNGYKVYVYLDDTGVYYEDVEPRCMELLMGYMVVTAFQR